MQPVLSHCPKPATLKKDMFLMKAIAVRTNVFFVNEITIIVHITFVLLLQEYLNNTLSLSLTPSFKFPAGRVIHYL